MEASPYIIITRLGLINHSLPITLSRHEMSSYREEAGDVEAAPHHARQRRGRTVGGQLRRRRKWALSRSPACTEQPRTGAFCAGRDMPPLTIDQKRRSLVIKTKGGMMLRTRLFLFLVSVVAAIVFGNLGGGTGP
jgi:hypothetical protein